ncbi:PucR family transcriptional regulator [uncultured Allofournierella sp.]|uniref:PucR family transcriptional regulator n=1 Tax=uncultured Allofournierella sp. TaxID=1940258 RepID=UPI0037525276
MSVTVKRALELPSLRQAVVLAGQSCLDRPITGVTVFEPACPSPEPGAFEGGELVLTCFSTMVQNPQSQCDALRSLSAAGQSALVLFYVGIVMPEVPQELVQLAQELEFPLLVMPAQQALRYSEVISDVMEAILLDQTDDSHLLGDVVEHMTLLPAHQQTVDTVLQLVSDRLRATVLLLDGEGQVLGAAAWPRGIQTDVADLLLQARQGDADQCCRMNISVADKAPMELYLLKGGRPLSSEAQQQVQNILCMAVDRWSFKHAELAIEELLRAILKDEPIKMRRMAALFRLDVASIHCMWILSPVQPRHRDSFLQKAPALATQLLEPCCQAMVTGSYQDFVVVMADNGIFGPSGQALAQELQNQLAQQGLPCVITCCQGLESTNQVRQAFLRCAEGLPSAHSIWPQSTFYTQGEIDFALYCKNHLAQDEACVADCRAALAPLQAPGDDLPLVETLAVYLLDAQQSISRCAQLLFLHKNTVKYRYQQISHRLGYDPDRLPEMSALYRAVALYRLLRN